MTKETIFRVYKILLSILIVVSGCCFVYGSLSIFFSGANTPYSRQIVADTFSKICIPIYITVALIVIGFILDFFISYKSKVKTSKQNDVILNNLIKIKDTQNNDTYIKLKRKIKITKIINIIVTSLCGVIFLVYALNPNNFYLLKENGSFNFNSAIINAMWVFLPCIAIAFISAVTSHYITNLFVKQLINVLTNLPKKDTSSQTINSSSNKKSLIIKISILTVGIALLFFGAIFGGYKDVLTKAVQICTECIGLG